MNFPERGSPKHHEAIQPCFKDEKSTSQIGNMMNGIPSDTEQMVSRYVRRMILQGQCRFSEKFINHLFYISVQTIQHIWSVNIVLL